MNLQQLEYIVAVDTHRHFVRAAEHCYVTQPTLSSMIQKLEEELGVKIFDRSKQPVVPTEAGRAIIEQARIVLREAGRLEEIARQEKSEIKGELHLGVIPTLAPYLLPLFLRKFAETYPQVKLLITEHHTDSIVTRLREGSLDAALLATPLGLGHLRETVLFYERFFAYVAEGEAIDKEYILIEEMDVDKLWLLEEGHCLRTQVVQLCALRDRRHVIPNVSYEAGSLETLKRMVDQNGGATILPELAVKDLPRPQAKRIRHFQSPSPTREISLVTYQHFVKENLLEALRTTIVECLPPGLLENHSRINLAPV